MVRMVWLAHDLRAGRADLVFVPPDVPVHGGLAKLFGQVDGVGGRVAGTPVRPDLAVEQPAVGEEPRQDDGGDNRAMGHDMHSREPGTWPTATITGAARGRQGYVEASVEASARRVTRVTSG